MPKGTLYQSPALENVAVAYKNDMLIADQVIPSVPVVKQSGKVYKFGKDAFRIPTKITRAPGSVSARVQSYSVSTDTYSCDNHAVNDIVPNEDTQNADAAIKPEISTTEGLVDIIKLAREKALADYLFNTTTFASYYAALEAADRWNNYATSDPLKKISDAIESVRKTTGAKANTVVLGKAVFEALRLHPGLTAYFQYVIGGMMTQEQVLALLKPLGIERLLIGGAIYNSADEDTTPTFTTADIWGKYALIAYVAPKPDLRKPSLGYCYRWITGNQGYTVYRTQKDGAGEEHGIVIEVMDYYDDIVHDAGFGYLYSTAID